jgi:hypothetical protein
MGTLLDLSKAIRLEVPMAAPAAEAMERRKAHGLADQMDLHLVSY